MFYIWKQPIRALVLLASLLCAALAAQPVHAQSLDWAEQAGGTSYDIGHGIAVDGLGNSYVTGFFENSADFGDITLTSAGGRDIFVAKYDASGALLWARQAGGGFYDCGNAVAVDGSGNSYVTGFFGGSADFGDITLNSAGYDDTFVAKYDASGTLLWATQTGGISFDRSYGIAVDVSGNSYVTGSFEDSADFGDITLNSAGAADIFVAKYDASGTLHWAKQTGGISFDRSYGIAVDVSGNSYVTGYFEGNATFGAGEPHETTLTSVDESDIFVTKHDTSGALVWATQAGGTSIDRGYGIAVDGLGNSYVASYFEGNATFGAGEAVQAGSIHAAQAAATTLTSEGISDIFVAKYGDVPLAVTLGYFLATPSEEGVRIEWSTATETGNAGFNLYVETEAGQQQINPALIPSTVIDSLEPQRYAYDAVGVQGDSFFIELVNVNGGSRMFGPFALSVPFGAAPAAEEGGHRIFLPSVLKR